MYEPAEEVTERACLAELRAEAHLTIQDMAQQLCRLWVVLERVMRFDCLFKLRVAAGLQRRPTRNYLPKSYELCGGTSGGRN